MSKKCDHFQIPEYIPEHHTGLTFFDPLSCQTSHATFGEWPRESGQSSTSGSTNRNRQLLLGVMMALSLTNEKQLCVQDISKDLKIYNTECNGAVHKSFHNAFGENYICSEYISLSTVPGSMVNGVRHENLEKLSFENNSFDIVLSSEVFEHVPHPYKAHSEVLRVLKKGGRHVFTVPFHENNHEDDNFASLMENGTIVYHKTPIYHGDPVHKGGVLVYNVFSKQMFHKLCKMGFSVNIFRIHNVSYGVFGPGNLVFVAKK